MKCMQDPCTKDGGQEGFPLYRQQARKRSSEQTQWHTRKIHRGRRKARLSAIHSP